MQYNLILKPRPPGMGAFFDYGAALKRHFAREVSRARSWRKKGLAAQPEDSDEDRWDAEGGNCQTGGRAAGDGDIFEPQKIRGQSPKS